eukprot:scaffold80376_cov26-Tisochrysis_lutea.AAC.2
MCHSEICSVLSSCCPIQRAKSADRPELTRSPPQPPRAPAAAHASRKSIRRVTLLVNRQPDRSAILSRSVWKP